MSPQVLFHTTTDPLRRSRTTLSVNGGFTAISVIHRILEMSLNFLLVRQPLQNSDATKVLHRIMLLLKEEISDKETTPAQIHQYLPFIVCLYSSCFISSSAYIALPATVCITSVF
jgi:hypothetical protein